MRKLTFIVAILAALYAGYWFIGSSAVEKGVTGQIAKMNEAGWDITYSDLGTKGFPSRFDTSATDLSVTTPEAGFTWNVPFVQANALSYRPNSVIAVFPNQQEIIVNGQPIVVNSDGLRANLAVAAGTDLELSNLTAEVGEMSLELPSGPLTSISSGLFALRPAIAPLTYDAYLTLDNLDLPPALRALLDPRGTLPETLSQTVIDAQITLDEKLDRHALASKQLPLVDKVELNSAAMTWGALELRGTGEITIDLGGVPTGQITLSATNWQQMFDIALKIGALDAQVGRTLRNAGLLLSGGSNDISIPLSFKGGNMFIGPIPAGAAPRFR
ncbi:MAG: DUF2125 domain-containing protein [Loktanella sp.]|jgi:hypothetical protein|nr:DUF2125 domain-containing protein [Loktanella sp.]MDO7608205.1 DUF2125 domain-containing protein [Loktanella sp.]MDO7623919.1 DUF2125 domain-containing protein [Loktanella sp.]MDO7627342.1 DUF2125 domain-containing protein [Loktanella sp.]MDO7630981.1 DUF2125 domain-containing protein [Loktanella sp.]